jgi:hypothetical protein
LYWCEFWSLILRAFENGLLRKIFGPKIEEVAGGWSFITFYSSPNVIRVINSRKMGRMTEIARMGEVGVGELEGRDHLEDLGIDGKIILEWMLWK